MKSSYTGKEMETRRKVLTLTFRKEEFECVYHTYVCADTHEEFEDDRLTLLNMQQVTDQYREKHNIPFPEQIKTIRENYGLSAAKMSEILGLGINTWRLYENGEVPTIANARLIQLISDPQNFLKHINEFGICSKKDIDKISKKVEELNFKAYHKHFLEERFSLASPNRINGYTLFNTDKFAQVILFFTSRMLPYKTTLNKLLFYADFLHFKQTGRSITGLTYAAIDFGPVPDRYSLLYEMMTDLSVLKTDGILTEYGYSERMLPGDEVIYNEKLFSETESAALNEVYQKLQGKTTKEIVEMSHQEEAWIKNNQTKSLVPYTYAYYLKTM